MAHWKIGNQSKSLWHGVESGSQCWKVDNIFNKWAKAKKHAKLPESVKKTEGFSASKRYVRGHVRG